MATHAPKLARRATAGPASRAVARLASFGPGSRGAASRPGGRAGRKGDPEPGTEAEELASQYKNASEEFNSHDMAAFFLAPYKAQIDSMQAERLPSGARSKLDDVRIALVQAHLAKKRYEVRTGPHTRTRRPAQAAPRQLTARMR